MQNPSNEQNVNNTLPVGQEQLDSAKHVAEQKIDEAIDQFAEKIPGGTQFTQQAKEAASGILDNLEKEAEEQGGSMLGNLGKSVGGIFGQHNEEHK